MRIHAMCRNARSGKGATIMTLNYWDPMREFANLRRELDRFFERTDNYWTFPFTRFSFLPGRAARAYPLLNISEDADNVYIEALAPGVDPQSLKVEVIRDQLSISGEKPAAVPDGKAEGYHRNERAAGRFVRTFTLPAEVEQDKVDAEYRDGLLTITLPKAEAAKPRQITVNMK
ncbi:MAG TPA: Hsp20/alpha crystallin family protein [Candidatus Sumerlaeota bacterium]|nr:Hsp20/alpha crystallin family protein [Candidatus Sumerlaeota bacterium]HOR27242.1 Hsp20/alpha crystallin family protein [Candidatus Sumerlaeota bacterium]HPK01798.1 Hsp20/alpha crystallin family protein [Candidatus Sumerlaeota bacterium]